MAQDYTKVLEALDTQFEVIGRGEDSASTFSKKTGIQVQTGGVKKALEEQGSPDTAIVSVRVTELFEVASTLIKAGTRRILLEKPGGLYFEQIRLLNEIAEDYCANVWLAYNRRFYSSTLKAEEMIEEDGGIISVQFDFTEWAHLFTNNPIKEIEYLFLGNSTHVVDLVFHMCGIPKDWNSWRSGSLEWHKTSARFAGAGITEGGVLFSYLSDWESPGSWGIEFLTRKHRLIFRPMEKLHVMELRSVKVEQVLIDDGLDLTFKPGVYRQTEAFLNQNYAKLCSLEEQVKSAQIYSTMAGY
jgi:predicted dehydrogenase